MAKLSPDASLIADDGLVATSSAGLEYPWGDRVPGAGEVIRIAPGISWARLPMFGSLGHINTWLLDDADGAIAPVDTGLMLEPCSNAWKALFAGDLAGKTISRVFCTHMHPDHTGLAGWLCKKFDVKLWMSRGEWLTAKMLLAGMREAVAPEVIAERRFAGWSEQEIAETGEPGYSKFAKVMFPLPISFRRLVDDEIVPMGAHQWRVVVGSGHSPEHACLWNEKEGVLVSGDQVLPKISSNVSVNISEPDANPLAEWLDSIEKLLKLPDDLLVCPAHGQPFKGLHTRLKALREEHHKRLETLEAFIAEPRRVVDSFGLLFNRVINEEHRPLASGEALAHLRYLEVAGRARCTVEDGVGWFTRIG